MRRNGTPIFSAEPYQENHKSKSQDTGWRVHAWVIMGNHHHLFIETPEANLVERMKWLRNTYTRRFDTFNG